MVSHPETGLDSPIGSDRDRGHDKNLNIGRKNIFEIMIRA